MFALHMVHGMFPDMFKEDVSISAVYFTCLIFYCVYIVHTFKLKS